MSPFEKFVAGTIVAVCGDWFTMLWLGAAHSQDARVPALGFWTVFCLTGALSSATAASFYALRDREASGR